MELTSSRKRAAKTADEVDAFSSARHDYRWRPGERKKIKRQASRRERQEGKEEAGEQVRDDEWSAIYADAYHHLRDSGYGVRMAQRGAEIYADARM